MNEEGFCDSFSKTIELMKIAGKWGRLQKEQLQGQEAADPVISDTELPGSVREGLHTDLKCCHRFQKFHRWVMETASMSLNILDNERCIRDGGNIAREAVRTK